MPKSNAQNRINARVDQFFTDLRALVQEAVREAARDALGNVGSTTAPPRRAKSGTRKTTRKAAGGKRGKRVRRSAKALAATGNKILAHVRANPGAGMSDLTSAIGGSAIALRGPLNLLLADGKLRKEGQKRGTKYYAGGGKPKAAKKTRKKAGRKATRKPRRKKAAKRKAKES